MGQRRRLLFADDLADMRLMVDILFSSAGWDVDLAADGAGATGLMDQRSYDVVVLDHVMPDENGIGVARRIRSGGFGGPILLYSGRLDLVPMADLDEVDAVAVDKSRVEHLLSTIDRLCPNAA